MLYLPARIPMMIANFVGFKNNRNLWDKSGLSSYWSSSIGDGDLVALPTACFCVPTHKFLMVTSSTSLRLLMWAGMWDGAQQYALLLSVSSTSDKNPPTADPGLYLNSCVYLDKASSATELLWLCLIIRHAYKVKQQHWFLENLYSARRTGTIQRIVSDLLVTVNPKTMLKAG